MLLGRMQEQVRRGLAARNLRRAEDVVEQVATGP